MGWLTGLVAVDAYEHHRTNKKLKRLTAGQKGHPVALFVAIVFGLPIVAGMAMWKSGRTSLRLLLVAIIVALIVSVAVSG